MGEIANNLVRQALTQSNVVDSGLNIAKDPTNPYTLEQLANAIQILNRSALLTIDEVIEALPIGPQSPISGGTSNKIFAGNFTLLNATNSITVTFGFTVPDTSYKVVYTTSGATLPNAFYRTGTKTTTTFTVNSSINAVGNITFDYIMLY